MSPKTATSPCHFLPLLPPITRNVKLPIPANPLEFKLCPRSPSKTTSQSGKNGNVHHPSQHCHPVSSSLLSHSLRPLRPPRFNSPSVSLRVLYGRSRRSPAVGCAHRRPADIMAWMYRAIRDQEALWRKSKMTTNVTAPAPGTAARRSEE